MLSAVANTDCLLLGDPIKYYLHRYVGIIVVLSPESNCFSYRKMHVIFP